MTRYLKCTLLLLSVKGEVENRISFREASDADESGKLSANPFGVIDNPNKSFEAVMDEEGNFVSIDQIASFTDEISGRNKKFESPPVWLMDELASDRIADYWEQCPKNSFVNEESEKCFDYQPRIGILTQPVYESKQGAFPFDSYILEVNYNFIRWSGSVPVAIPYDIDYDDLELLLP